VKEPYLNSVQAYSLSSTRADLHSKEWQTDAAFSHNVGRRYLKTDDGGGTWSEGASLTRNSIRIRRVPRYHTRERCLRVFKIEPKPPSPRTTSNWICKTRWTETTRPQVKEPARWLETQFIDRVLVYHALAASRTTSDECSRPDGGEQKPRVKESLTRGSVHRTSSRLSCWRVLIKQNGGQKPPSRTNSVVSTRETMPEGELGAHMARQTQEEDIKEHYRVETTWPVVCKSFCNPTITLTMSRERTQELLVWMGTQMQWFISKHVNESFGKVGLQLISSSRWAETWTRVS
jgi:hypothetical protein